MRTPPNITRAVKVKRLTWYILMDSMAEAWHRNDPAMLADIYRATTTAANLLNGRA